MGNGLACNTPGMVSGFPIRRAQAVRHWPIAYHTIDLQDHLECVFGSVSS